MKTLMSNHVRARTDRAAKAAEEAGFSLDDGVIYGIKGYELKAHMCGQAVYGNKYVTCGHSTPCPFHYPERHLIQFGEIYSTEEWVGFSLPPEPVKSLATTRFHLVLGSDQDFPNLPCFRIPDLKGGRLYAISHARFIIRLQEGDVIVHQNIKHRLGDGWPDHDDWAYLLVRTTPEGRKLHTIIHLAFDRPKRNLRQRLKSCFVQSLPTWLNELPLPILK